MRVLKFGGTSVGSIANINQVINIVSKGAQDQNIAVVVSALGGVTDLLMQCGSQASKKEEYSAIYTVIESKHLEFISALVKNDQE
ncbi:MAG: bifunctional aspartate kinase/homoserine dehydrogenase I, partial [Leeuwenhoekiella sp.]|nr:bifunctional aspartate kinase/homoserine dehydrogenase I [Leeuwenhoekiella sp.]